jgi:hypothetical protein
MAKAQTKGNHSPPSKIREKKYNKNDIETSNIYYALKEQEGERKRSLVIEFRRRLESILFRKRVYDVKFHPVQWRYFKNKYKQEQSNNWQSKKGKSVFTLDFFVQDSRFTGEISFDSLTDDEKVQIVVPKKPPISPFHEIFGANDFHIPQENQNKEYFESLTDERKTEILAKLKSSLHSYKYINDEDPYQWYRWEYDVYSLYSKCKVDFKKDKDDFVFFFAWKLSLCKYSDVKLFLGWHLGKTFRKNHEMFAEFISLLLMEYKNIVNDPDLIKITYDFLNPSPISEIKMEELNQPRKPKKRQGRPVSEKIELIKPIERLPRDKKTLLDKEGTAKLFSYLIQLDCTLSGQDNSKDNLSKSIQGLTGFSASHIKDLLIYEDFRPVNKQKAKAIVEKINDLIIKAIDDKKWG